MTNSNESQLKGNSNGKFEAMWAEIVRLDIFNFTSINFIPKNKI